MLRSAEYLSRLVAVSVVATLLTVVASNRHAHAQTSVVDFTDGDFVTITNSMINDEPIDFSETVDGVTFTLESTLNQVGIERFLFVRPGVASNGLQLGGGGGSTIEFTLVVDQDILLESYSTDTGGTFLNTPTFDVTGPGVNSIGNPLAQGNAANGFAAGPLSLAANEVYTFDIQSTGAAVQAFVASFTFQPVPEPASGLLLGASLLGAGLMRRRG